MGRHLSDLRLHDFLDAPRSAANDVANDDAHLAGCPECQTRLASLEACVGQIVATDDAAFEAAFPAARVAASRERILSAVAEHRSARVVAFPGAAPPAAPSLRARPRWMAAAAAGLIVGLALGRWTHWGAPVRPVPSSASSTQTVVQQGIQPAVYIPADDDLLNAVESASLGPVSDVWSLHELTPLAERHDAAW
jgi:hypothetical protein